jgi:hypothetical protein
MKNFYSNIEGTWFEILSITLTNEQKALLKSKKESDQEAKIELKNYIYSEKFKSVSDEKKTELNNLYSNVKPQITETDIYDLIDISVMENNSGILNCRLNQQHLQIRF